MLNIQYLLKKEHYIERLKNLTKLYLQRSDIKEIDERAFETCSNLLELWLNNNKLTNLYANTFKNLNNLIKINLSDNQIVAIDGNTFETCSNLVELWLNNNKLTSLHANTFKNLTKLTKLNIGNNQIKEIDQKAFENCSKLEDLWLNNNKLTRLHADTFKNLTKLIKLSIDNNQIVEIGQKAFETCSNITRLYLNKNKLTSLNANTFNKLTKLNQLDLSNNNFVNELDLLFETVNLELFDISFNHFEKIKLEFTGVCIQENVNQIISINISSNDISNFSDIHIDSKNKKSIFEINARFNFIQSVFKSEKIDFQNKKFDLSRNPLNSSCLQKITENETYRKIFLVEIKQKDENRYINNIDFDTIKEEYPHLKNIKNWNDISSFSVITGKNGVGKSTLLNYIKDYVQEIYKNESTRVCFIPVVYKMHDKIKPDMSNSDELKNFAKNWYDEINPTKKWFNEEIMMTWDNFQQVLEIFSIDSIDKLILHFEKNIDRINQQFNDFKYKIEINDDLQKNVVAKNELKNLTEKFQKDFKEKVMRLPETEKNHEENPDTKISSSNLSPGEQLMLLFRLWEFALTRYDIPHIPVLLLDEPDAHLHPKAVKDFVDILRKLADAGAQMIMTTHNPTTVSFVPHENLYCMKKIEGKEIVIEISQSKADIIRELTSNLLVVSDNYRTVLVEGEPSQIDTERIKYEKNQRDSIFYQNILTSLNESGIVLKNQYLFKSFNGCENIIPFMKSLDTSKFFQDLLGIIDNDNYLRIVSNQDKEISEYYDNIVLMSDSSSEFDGRVKNVYHLLRHSFENYALDPVNLFCYLNCLRSRNEQTSDLKVSEIKIYELYEKITSRTKIDKSDLAKMKNLTDIKKIIKNGQIELVQAIISSMGELIVDYLCEKEDNLNHRLFNYSELTFLQNLVPIFRFLNKENNYRRTTLDEIKNEKFCSVCFSVYLVSNKLSEDKKWIERKKLLKDSTKEDNQKKEELKNVVTFIQKLKKISEPLNSFKTLNLKKCLDILNLLRDKDNTISQDDLDKVKDSYPDIKAKVDEELIREIRTRLLDETIDCCFAGHQQIVFKYPKLFYYLNGHFFEKIIYSMFFDPNVDLQNPVREKPMLIDKIVQNDGLMNECGYLVPNDLCQIFKRIDSFTTSS